MIKIENLSYSYKKYQALNNINLVLKPGLIGLIGENGAGKTTLMNIISTLLSKQEGNITVLGKKLENNNTSLEFMRENIGYMPQDFDFYPLYKVKDVLMYLAILNNVDTSLANTRIDEILNVLNLIDKKECLVKSLSGGMKRRLGLACALIKNPKILIVDEPTVGLDPKERINMRNYLKKYSKDRIVIMSTHIVEDIEKICDELVIISKGSLIYNGTKEELLKKELYTYEIECSEEEVIDFESIGNITCLEYIDEFVKFRITLKRKLKYKLVESNIEDIYMYLIGDTNELI